MIKHGIRFTLGMGMMEHFYGLRIIEIADQVLEVITESKCITQQLWEIL